MSRRIPREDLSLPIVALGDDGLGHALHGVKPVRVRNALPGEQIQTRVLKRKRGQLLADGVALQSKPHAQRRVAACSAFPRCGGCAFHHLDYTAQLQMKAAGLRDALAKHKVDVQRWREPTTAGRLGYRRKARLGVRQVGDQVLVGFRESFSNRVARLEGCPVLTPEASALLLPLRELLGQLTIAARIPQIEVAQGDRRLSLIVRHLQAFCAADLEKLGRFEQRHRIEILLQSGGYDTLQRIDGTSPSLLDYSLPQFGLNLSFAPEQFTQVNAGMNEILVNTAVGYLGPLKQRSAIDLFCGIGNFSLAIRRAGASVLGIEMDASAVARARENAQHNGLNSGVEFRVADLYRPDPLHLPQADALVLDPPRSGAGPQLGAWLDGQSRLARVVYISCNPQSFAADAAILSQRRFKLREVGIYDMFPFTSHVETVGLFERS